MSRETTTEVVERAEDLLETVLLGYVETSNGAAQAAHAGLREVLPVIYQHFSDGLLCDEATQAAHLELLGRDLGSPTKAKEALREAFSKALQCFDPKAVTPNE